MFTERVRSFISTILIIAGLVALSLSFLETTVSTCSGFQGVQPTCAYNYGSLILYATISAAFIIGGMYLMANRSQKGKVAPLMTP